MDDLGRDFRFRLLNFRLVTVRLLVGVTLFCFALSGAAFAKDSPDYTHIGRDINIASGQAVGDVTCIGCSVHIRGQVSGEVTAVGGSISIEDQGQVGGDVTAVAGGVRLEQEAKVMGDTTVVGGELRRAAGAKVGGDVTSVGGPFWAPLILLAPLLIVGLLVALVIWIVQRMRRPAIPATAA